MAVFIVGCGQATWQEVSSEAGRFSVQMPGKPTEETQSIGPLALYSFTLDKKLYILTTAYVDYPEGFEQGRSSDQILDDARDGAVQSTNGKLVSEEQISLDGHPGREFKIQPPDDKSFGTMRIYLVNNRLYQLMFITTKDGLYTQERQQFFDSFKLRQ